MRTKNRRRMNDKNLLAQKISAGFGVLGFFGCMFGLIFWKEYYQNITLPFIFGVYGMMGMLVVGMLIGAVISSYNNNNRN